jgi:hypothetical protein
VAIVLERAAGREGKASTAVAAAAGRPDQAFWKSFYKWNDRSGGAYVSGWINVLFPYLQREGAGGTTAAPEWNLLASHWAEGLDAPFGTGPDRFPSDI